MAQQKAEHRIDSSDEVIQLGPLRVYFLRYRRQLVGSIAVFELIVAGGARQLAPAIATTIEETIYGVDER